MKVELWATGKTDEKYLETGIAIFEKRLSHYLPFTLLILPDPKTKRKEPATIREEEGKTVLAKLSQDDYLVLLDERGVEFTSPGFASWMEKRLAGGRKKMVFLIGGPFGFSPEVYARADEKIALSKLTFSHQMVRLFFAEQLYRAMTILKNEPYHNP